MRRSSHLVLEDGLDLVSGYLEDGTKAVEEDGMEMEEEQIMQDGNDKQVDLDDEFQSLTDGEEKEKMQDEVDDIGGGGLGYCQWISDGGGCG